jgi:hypothetical protein
VDVQNVARMAQKRGILPISGGYQKELPQNIEKIQKIDPKGFFC